MSARRRAAWCGAGALALVPLLFPPGRDPDPVPLLLFGPLAELAAQVQWLRFHSASLRGEEARALELAESALALDPRASEGWETLAAHLVFDLASREREPGLARRRAWFRSGLAVLREGTTRASRPGELEVFLCVVLWNKAKSDPELDPGGAEALRAAARKALERARSLGGEGARDLQRLEDAQ